MYRNIQRLIPTQNTRLFSTVKLLKAERINAEEVRVSLGRGATTFHAPWLAHNCSCPKCRQESSGQRLAQKSPPRSIEAVEVSEDQSKLRVEFSKDHVGEFSADFLDQHRYDSLTVRARSMSLSALSRTKKAEPVRLDYNQANSSRKSTLQWMEAVINDGVVIVENSPPKEEVLLDFIKHTGCESSHQLYGKTFVVEATANPLNVAYSSEALEAHQDLAYYESPPGIQLLHCLEFDEKIQGGLSTFVDGHAAAEILRRDDPDAFQVLCRVPATFQKDHVRRADPAKMYYQRPHILTNELGDVTAIFWAPPFEGPLRASHEDVMPYYKAYDKFAAIMASEELWAQHAMEFKLRKGDLMVFNNRRYLHGRTAFTVPVDSKGFRKLHGCYLEMDRFLNRIRVMHWEENGTAVYDLKSRPGTSSYRN